MAAYLILFPVLALLMAPALCMVLGRPRFLKDIAKSDADFSVSIIIPARDEEHNIGNLLDSINTQSLPPREVIVVDDESQDSTASVAASKGARVIASKALPSDWKGKPWACQQGADAATGDWLLFLDADTRLAPDALSRLNSLTVDDAVFSICPHHAIERPYEELSAFFNVLMTAGMNAFGTGSSSGKNAALFGQCLLISKKNYQKAGRHAAVKAEVLENFHWARQLRSLGIQTRNLLGRDSVSMRMFPGGISELWNSWKKGFTTGASHTAKRALIYASVWLSGAIMCGVAMSICLVHPSPLMLFLTGAAYIIYAVQCWWAFGLVGRFSFWNALFFPISLIFYQILFFTALLDKKLGKTTTWKGREVN